LPDR